jgi:diacylglycerol kinase family enzyme
MRALLVTNPKATTTTDRSQDVLVNALSADLDLTVAHTERRGHATDLAREAARSGYDLVIALGGDGTVNEVVNGLLTEDTDDTGGGLVPGLPRPKLAVVPGGSTNVFARALGLPNDPIEATGVVLAALREGRGRAVSIGEADGRYFTFCAGFGFDASVVGLVERRRADGHRAGGGLYVRSAIRQYLASGYLTGRHRDAPIRVEIAGDEVGDLHLAVVANTAPWTYLGQRPIRPMPHASFDSALDLFGLTSMRPLNVLSTIRSLLRDGRPARRTVERHDVAEITLVSDEPTDFQLDGEHLGQRRKITVRDLPDAITVIV